MEKINAWLTVAIGVLLVLALLGIAVDTLGTVTSGALGWVIALAVLVIGILKLVKK